MLLPDWTIDDATPGSTGITPGHSSTPPSLITQFSSSVLQRTSIEIHRPPSREARTLLELSSEYITCRSRQSSSFAILNQQDSRTQQVSLASFVSAEFLRIEKILRISRLPYMTDSRHGFSSIEPQPPTVSPQLRALSRVLILSSKDSPDFCGFVGCDVRAPSPLLSSSSLDVLCPFVGLLVYGHRPSRFMPTGFVTVLCLRALFIYACGPFSFMPTGLLAFISKGPCPFC